MVDLIGTKLERQAEVAEHLAPFRSTARMNGDGVSVAEAIRQTVGQLSQDLTYQRLRAIEAIAGRYYWTAWAQVPVRFERSAAFAVPEHWQTAGPRTSIVDRKSARRAATPVHAMLNYGYAILEAEAILACHAVGLDPALGLMHADTRYRGSLATDLMEPVRSIVDNLALALLTGRELRRDDCAEMADGTCRVGARLARELSSQASRLRAEVNPQARHFAGRLLEGSKLKSPAGRRAPTARVRSPVEKHREPESEAQLMDEELVSADFLDAIAVATSTAPVEVGTR